MKKYRKLLKNCRSKISEIRTVAGFQGAFLPKKLLKVAKCTFLSYEVIIFENFPAFRIQKENSRNLIIPEM